jgi:hypothetical protein
MELPDDFFGIGAAGDDGGDGDTTSSSSTSSSSQSSSSSPLEYTLRVYLHSHVHLVWHHIGVTCGDDEGDDEASGNDVKRPLRWHGVAATASVPHKPSSSSSSSSLSSPPPISVSEFKGAVAAADGIVAVCQPLWHGIREATLQQPVPTLQIGR